MIRFKTKPWQGLQSFIFMPDGSIFWTSASNTILDRIISGYRKLRGLPKLPEMAHTSLGKKIRGHGQWIFLEGDRIVFDNGSLRFEYDFDLNLLSEGKSSSITRDEIYKLPGVPPKNWDKGYLLNQGIDYYQDNIYTVFGNARNPDAEAHVHDLIHNHIKKIVIDLRPKLKWFYDDHYEIEGIRVHPDTGDIWAGVSFRTYWLTRHNYRFILLK